MLKRFTNADAMAGFATLVFCAVWITLARSFPPGMQDGVPGCGTFPVIVSVILAVLGFGLLIRGVRRPECFFNFAAMSRTNAVALIATMAVFFAYLWSWGRFGYLPATIGMTMALGLIYRLGWRLTLVVSLAYGLSTYLLFGKILMVYLELH